MVNAAGKADVFLTDTLDSGGGEGGVIDEIEVVVGNGDLTAGTRLVLLQLGAYLFGRGTAQEGE